VSLGASKPATYGCFKTSQASGSFLNTITDSVLVVLLYFSRRLPGFVSLKRRHSLAWNSAILQDRGLTSSPLKGSSPIRPPTRWAHWLVLNHSPSSATRWALWLVLVFRRPHCLLQNDPSSGNSDGSSGRSPSDAGISRELRSLLARRPVVCPSPPMGDSRSSSSTVFRSVA